MNKLLYIQPCLCKHLAITVMDSNCTWGLINGPLSSSQTLIKDSKNQRIYSDKINVHDTVVEQP